MTQENDFIIQIWDEETAQANTQAIENAKQADINIWESTARNYRFAKYVDRRAYHRHHRHTQTPKIHRPQWNEDPFRQQTPVTRQWPVTDLSPHISPVSEMLVGTLILALMIIVTAFHVMMGLGSIEQMFAAKVSLFENASPSGLVISGPLAGLEQFFQNIIHRFGTVFINLF
ncbi:hypothetical protein BXT84_14080 [Sulfobacillus thermotolerans]|uniref:Uncharacterized protein n=1 Tax=Sulfobacillus thermotolerans TaxID=338644 RepID=A0ABM6RUD3_9FIRM|nr:hypothetical protein BXT84_14080 [Sulfobacillus thermotolerans]